jgi:ketosteroid isomerase-like protein
MSQENVEIVRRVFDAADRRDADAIFALYDPDVEWDASRMLPGLGEFTEVAHGHDGLRRFFGEWLEAWESDEYVYDELIDTGGDVVVSIATQRGRGRVSGVEVARLLAGVWTIRAGRIVRVVWFPTRAEALEAVGLSE